MVSITRTDKTEKVGITLPNSLIKQTDVVRGDIPRSTYIRKAVEYYLKQAVMNILLGITRTGKCLQTDRYCQSMGSISRSSSFYSSVQLYL